MTRSAEVDAYIAGAPEVAGRLLAEIRRLVFDAAPSVVESIRYGMPSYAYRGRPFVHVSAAKAHVAVYGLVHVDGEIPEELAAFLDHRSTLRFKLNEPLPSDALQDALRRKASQFEAEHA